MENQSDNGGGQERRDYIAQKPKPHGIAPEKPREHFQKIVAVDEGDCENRAELDYDCVGVGGVLHRVGFEVFAENRASVFVGKRLFRFEPEGGVCDYQVPRGRHGQVFGQPLDEPESERVSVVYVGLRAACGAVCRLF